MSNLWSGVKKEERCPSPGLGASAQEKFDGSLSSPLPLDMKVKEEPLKKEERLSPFFTSPMYIKTEPKTEPKAELEASPSQSPTLHDNDMSPQKSKLSPSPTPPPSTTTGTPSMASTPPPTPSAAPAVNSKSAKGSSVQLIGDLPIARDEALATFNEILENNYQYKTLGRSREAFESMTCDCTYEHGTDSLEDACGADSDCINRLTQVECLPEDCRCRSYCKNQRFQKREYSNIQIIQTEKKGFGLRAEVDLPKDAFIYEYVGDVVNPISFKKRMRDYALEGIEHFYFMMLQKDEFIDATKSGGIGRFANHSCKPNCYVAKWTIGNHVRMGIFAKRNIKQHEELTFNYNVDRYGHQAQVCHCGESNCVGYIGGKTQTDIVTVDDLYLDALGITDEADLLELKGSKKKKGKKIDDPDFMPTMKPIVLKDVPKVVQAIRQTQSHKMLCKLLTRIKITEDQTALRQIMRLRGYSLMTNVLEDYASDLELMTLALECMSTWPLLNRNKVEDSRVIAPVKACIEQDNETVNGLAQSLIDHWETLPLYNRIPKRVKKDGEDDLRSPSRSPLHDDDSLRPSKRSKYEEERMKYEASLLGSPRWKPTPISKVVIRPRPPSPPPFKITKSEFSRESIRAVIAAAAEVTAANEAKAAEVAAAAVAAAEAEAEAKAATAEAKAAARAARKLSKSQKKVLTEGEKEANKEKRLLKLVGAVVVKYMSKYSKLMDHDLFKKHAKELTQLIADKEKKSSSYKEWKPDKLSDEKVAKIKKFAKDYIGKILRKLEKSGSRRPRPSSSTTTEATSSTLLDTPNSTEGVDVVMAGMTVEEAMDMDPDSGSEAEEMDMKEGGADTGGGSEARGSPTGLNLESSPAQTYELAQPLKDEMDLDEDHVDALQASDPRHRPLLEPRDIGWEPHQLTNGLSANS